jgi:ribosomal protein S25
VCVKCRKIKKNKSEKGKGEHGKKKKFIRHNGCFSEYLVQKIHKEIEPAI